MVPDLPGLRPRIRYIRPFERTWCIGSGRPLP